MVSISLCMIVKNEEDVLARCLASAADLVDEIIIVDTGSNDRTLEIASQFPAQVHHFEWIDDFSAARNYAFSLATQEYCLWMDADDMLLEDDRAAFLHLKKTLSSDVNVVMMKYHTGFDEQGNVTFSYYRERLIKNGIGMRWVGAVHEVIEPIGKTIYDDCAFTHHKLHPSDPDRNLRIFETQIAKGISLDPRQQFYYGRELYYHKRYTQALAVMERFLADGQGWVENQIDACSHCAYCLYALARADEALRALLRSLTLDLPRAEICCDIGHHFLERARYRESVFWYELALTCTRDDSRGGFYAPDCYGYLPSIQLCVCYSRMGDQVRAAAMNERAAHFKPNAAPVLANRKFFESLAENMPSA